jgi:hypothetical protein
MTAPLPKKQPYTHFVICNGSHINVQHIQGVLQPYMQWMCILLCAHHNFALVDQAFEK